MPRMRGTHYKHTLFKFNNPIFCFKMFLRTKKQENTSKTYQKASSLSPCRSLEWKGFQSSSSSGPSFSAQRHYVTRPKIKDFWERHNDLEPQSTGQFNCLPLEFSWFFNDKLPIIHTIWLSHNSQECHSELFHGVRCLNNFVQFLNVKLHFAQTIGVNTENSKYRNWL